MRLIDADALYYKVKCECNPYGKPTIDFESGKKVLNWIENAPTVEERHRGKWILCTDGRYYCQDCHIRKPDFAWDYCPQCGALMLEEGESE